MLGFSTIINTVQYKATIKYALVFFLNDHSLSTRPWTDGGLWVTGLLRCLRQFWIKVQLVFVFNSDSNQKLIMEWTGHKEESYRETSLALLLIQHYDDAP